MQIYSSCKNYCARRRCTGSSFLSRLFVIAIVVCLGACDAGDLERPTETILVDLRNTSTGRVDLEVSELRPADTDDDAELVLQYSLSGLDLQSLPPGSNLTITVVDDDGRPVAVSNAIAIDSQSADGEVTVIVPAGQGDEVAAIATVTADSSEDSSDTITETHAVLNIDLSNAVRPSELGLVDDFSLELVGGSYTSDVRDGRRLHRFAVRAYDQNCVSIRGLDENVDEFFTLFEDSFIDVESPVEYDTRNNFINVYFVLDASSSITDSDQVQILSAARYASDRLRDDYVVDFRQFSGDIQRLSSFRDYQPDRGQSATAFYYAIDTVLEEIDANGPSEDYHVIIGFTDGVDLASRNQFGTQFSHNAIKTFVRDKVEQFRTSPGFSRGSGLELHVLSVGDVEAERDNLNALAAAGGGEHVFASDKTVLEPLLESLVDRVLATYRLEYSSQQIADDTDLLLQVDINAISKALRIQFAGGTRPADQTHACRQR